MAIAGGTGLLVGVAGGLIGIGGGELRLPILVGLLGFAAKTAAPINLIITVMTILAAMASRLFTGAFEDTGPYLPEIAALIVGAVPLSFFGAGLLRRLSNRALSRIILAALLGVGLLMMAESLFGDSIGPFLGAAMTPRIIVSLVLGAAVGLVVSLLGVGGNELMIPILVVVLGMPIKAAGTSSLLVSLPTVLVGLWRFRAESSFRHHQTETFRTIIPLSLGSIVGAAIGGFLAPAASNATLKFLLGAILIYSALHSFLSQGDEAGEGR